MNLTPANLAEWVTANSPAGLWLELPSCDRTLQVCVRWQEEAIFTMPALPAEMVTLRDLAEAVERMFLRMLTPPAVVREALAEPELPMGVPEAPVACPLMALRQVRVEETRTRGKLLDAADAAVKAAKRKDLGRYADAVADELMDGATFVLDWLWFEERARNLQEVLELDQDDDDAPEEAAEEVVRELMEALHAHGRALHGLRNAEREVLDEMKEVGR